MATSSNPEVIREYRSSDAYLPELSKTQKGPSGSQWGLKELAPGITYELSEGACSIMYGENLNEDQCCRKFRRI